MAYCRITQTGYPTTWSLSADFAAGGPQPIKNTLPPKGGVVVAGNRISSGYQFRRATIVAGRRICFYLPAVLKGIVPRKVHKRKRRRPSRLQHGLFTIFGFTINLNTIITTVLGMIACTLLGMCWKWMHDTYKLVKAIPSIQAEQARVAREYHPETNPAATPFPSPVKLP